MTPASLRHLTDAAECLDLPQAQTSASAALMSQIDPFRTYRWLKADGCSATSRLALAGVDVLASVGVHVRCQGGRMMYWNEIFGYRQPSITDLAGRAKQS
jgi:hypothetical protein